MSLPTKLLEALFTEGMDARSLGQPMTACPYPEGSGNRVYWLEGWHDSDELDENEAPSDPVPGVEGV